MNWSSLKTSHFPKARELGLSFKHYKGKIYQIGPCEYASLDGETVGGFFWAPCEAALRRMVFRERVFCTEPTVPPPVDLLLAPGCVRYDAVLAEAGSGRFRYVRVRPPLPQRPHSTDFPDAHIRVERTVYFFRGESGLDPSETVYAIELDATDRFWSVKFAAPQEGGSSVSPSIADSDESGH